MSPAVWSQGGEVMLLSHWLGRGEIKVAEIGT